MEGTLQQIADGEQKLEELEEELDDLIFKYEKRKELRQNAQTSATEAKEQLENNLDRLVDWENTVNGDAANAEEDDDEGGDWS